MSVEHPLETPNCVGKNSVDRKIQSGNMRLTDNSWSFVHLKKRKTMEKYRIIDWDLPDFSHQKQT